MTIAEGGRASEGHVVNLEEGKPARISDTRGGYVIWRFPYL